MIEVSELKKANRALYLVAYEEERLCDIQFVVTGRMTSASRGAVRLSPKQCVGNIHQQTPSHLEFDSQQIGFDH